MTTASSEFNTDFRRSPTLFAATITILYLVAVAIQMSHHVMWRDELHQWQTLRPCRSIAEAIQALRYDGVPPLWNAIVYLLTRVSNDPRSLQATHALIAGSAVFVFARWGPFLRWMKLLFPVGYFMLYEYGVITRSYSLLFLLLLVACALLNAARFRWRTLVLVLFLTMQTSIWGAGFAVLLLLYAMRSRPVSRRQAALAAIVLSLGALLCWASVTPGPGRFFAPRSITNVSVLERFPAVLATVWKGLLPIPQWNPHFWNTNILDGFPWVQALLGALLLGACAWTLRQDPKVTILYVAGASGLLSFAYLFPGFTRHHGHLFILLVVCAWLARQARPLLLGPLLILHAMIGIGVAFAGMSMPFTDSKRISDYLQRNIDLDSVVLMGVPDYSTSPITQWLGRPIYFLDMRKFAWVNTQSDADRPGIKPRRLVPVIYSVMLEHKKPALLISTSGYKPWGDDGVIPVNPDLEQSPRVRIKVLRTFDQGIVSSESGTIYLITPE